METNFTVRNAETGLVYIDNAKTFTEAVKASEQVENVNLEMIKTTTEIIDRYENPSLKLNSKGNHGI